MRSLTPDEQQLTIDLLEQYLESASAIRTSMEEDPSLTDFDLFTEVLQEHTVRTNLASNLLTELELERGGDHRGRPAG
jgi:hypothetical protein